MDECEKMAGKLIHGVAKTARENDKFYGCRSSVMEPSDWASLATCYRPLQSPSPFYNYLYMYIYKYDKGRMRAKMKGMLDC